MARIRIALRCGPSLPPSVTASQGHYREGFSLISPFDTLTPEKDVAERPMDKIL